MIFDFSIDRGGTFTDIYCEVTSEPPSVHIMKLLSVDPQNYEDAPTEGIRRLVSELTGKKIERGMKIPTDQIRSIRMGTTVATNALLERKGEKVCLLISKGLKDCLEIGNQSRPNIFDLEIKKPLPVYEQVIEVNERIRTLAKDEDKTESILALNGQRYVVDTPLDLQDLKEKLTHLKQKTKIDSLAVVLMHSYALNSHELAVGKLAKELGFS